MHFTTVFAVLALSTAVQAVPSARTFASSQHSAHSILAHNHNSHQHIFPGVQQNTANHGHQVHVEDDSSVAVLVCQVVKVPAGRPVPQSAPAVPATPPNSCGLALNRGVFTGDPVKPNHPRQGCHGQPCGTTRRSLAERVAVAESYVASASAAPTHGGPA
ncbi:hypothetical protein MRX96_016368 [Rhipicephalus microplus]